MALPLLDIPESAWLHCKPQSKPGPGDVVFGRVNGVVTVGTVSALDGDQLVFHDGSSGELTTIRRADDLKSFGVVVRVTPDFA